MVCPHVALGEVVVIHNDTCTAGPPVEKLALFTPAQFGVDEKNADTAAWPGEAYPNTAANTTTDTRKILVRFIFCLFTS